MDNQVNRSEDQVIQKKKTRRGRRAGRNRYNKPILVPRNPNCKQFPTKERKTRHQAVAPKTINAPQLNPQVQVKNSQRTVHTWNNNKSEPVQRILETYTKQSGLPPPATLGQIKPQIPFFENDVNPPRIWVREDLQTKQQPQQKSGSSSCVIPQYMQISVSEPSPVAPMFRNSQTFGYFIITNSVFGNTILPVLPRFDVGQ